MNRLTISIFSFLFVITFFIHCGQSNSTSRRPVTAIQLEPQKKSYKLGEDIRMNLLTKIKDGTIDKIEIFVDGKKMQNSNILTNSILLKTADLGLGKHSIKISATKKDGVSGDNFDEIFVSSDNFQTASQYTNIVNVSDGKIYGSSNCKYLMIWRLSVMSLIINNAL